MVGISRPITNKRDRLTPEMIAIAIGAPTRSASAPRISDPAGLVPIAKLMTPKALPRIPARDTSITTVACMVENPAVPAPRTSSRTNDSR